MFLLVFGPTVLFAQITLPVDSPQKELSQISLKIWKQKTDSLKLKYNEEFEATFYKALTNENSRSNTFDSVAGITETHTDNRSIQIFTWNVPLANGKLQYFGFIRLQNPSNRVYRLKSNTQQSKIPVNEAIQMQNWYGALYYKVIEEKSDDAVLFTVLGWDGADDNLNRKILDIIHISNDSLLVFGAPAFKTENGIQQREVFEYAEKANCTLRYDYQAINVQKGKKIKQEKHWMIIADRLIPMDASMKGMPKFYVPAGDTYDGYLFIDGFWCLVKDIDVRNKTAEKIKLKK